MAALYQRKLLIGCQLLRQYVDEHPDCPVPATIGAHSPLSDPRVGTGLRLPCY